MNQLEKDNIKKAFADWEKQCIDGDILPVFLIGIADTHEIKLWKGGDYKREQIKEFLQILIDHL